MTITDTEIKCHVCLWKNNAKLFYALLRFIFKFLFITVSYPTGEPKFDILHNLCDTIIHFHEDVS